MEDIICPRCNIALLPEAISYGRIYHCCQCSGKMANMAILRNYLGPQVVKEFWQISMEKTIPSKIKCASCSQPLSQFSVCKNGQTLILDLCRNCQLIWFDKGELDVFPKIRKNEIHPHVEQAAAIAAVQLENESRNTIPRVFTPRDLIELILELFF